MKKYFLYLSLFAWPAIATAQLKTKVACPPFVVDVLDGKVDIILPTSTNGEIKGKFPCFTATQDESNTTGCGGNVMYADKDIYFYTGRDYIEIREKFKGKLSLPLMGAARNSLFKWLGLPKLKDATWDAFQTQYGTLILYYNKSAKVNKIQISTKSTDVIQLCE
jgi:hypothetical protein